MSEVSVGTFALVSGAAAAGVAVGAIVIGAGLIALLLRRASLPEDQSANLSEFCGAQSLLAQFQSQRDSALASAQATLPALTRAAALETALSNTPLLSALAQQHEQSLLSEARVAEQQSQQKLAQNDTAGAQQAAQRALTLRELAVQRAYDRLANAQQSVVGEVVAETLSEMGYQVQRRDAGNRTAMWATRGAESIAVVLNADGEFQMDMHGFLGQACRQERVALLQRLREKGIQLNLREATLHGDRHGGQWLKKALLTAKTQKLSVPDALLRTTAQAQSAQQDLRRRQQIVWGQRIQH